MTLFPKGFVFVLRDAASPTGETWVGVDLSDWGFAFKRRPNRAVWVEFGPLFAHRWRTGWDRDDSGLPSRPKWGS